MEASIDLGALRRWWAGPLDVGGLAADSVHSVVEAVGEVSAARGLGVAVSTSAQLVAASFAAVEHLLVDGRQGQGWAPYSGFFAAQDGWVRLHGNYPHHAAVIESVLGVDSPETLKLAIAALPAHEVAQRITEAHGIATAVRTETEWMAHPHAIATANEPWHTTTPGADRPPLAPGELPLTGVRVLDLTRVIAGPTCSQLLACLGADVMRIDPPHRPELLDQYLSNGMGKRSVAADLNQDADRIRRELLPTADVVLLGYRPGALSRFGLDADTLTTDHPQLIIGSLSAWGETGPWAHRPGFDSIVQATSGIADLYRGETGRPGALPVQALDHTTGHVLAAGVIGLLAAAQGGVVQTTLLGAARELLRRPRTFTGLQAAFDVPQVAIDSPHGKVLTTPPPLMLNGNVLSADIGQYGGGELTWR